MACEFLRVRAPAGKPPIVAWPPEITDRHRALAYAERAAQLQADAGERINEPEWRARLDRLGEGRDPAVAQIAELMAKTEAVEEVWAIRFSATADAHPACGLVANPFAPKPKP